MPLKTFGIYVAFPPNVKLDREGLGRYLSFFLAAAVKRRDVQFVIACPSWMRSTLTTLCSKESAVEASLSFVGPERIPFVLRMSDGGHNGAMRHAISKPNRKTNQVDRFVVKTAHKILRKAAATRSRFVFHIIMICAAIAGLAALPLAIFIRLINRKTKGTPKAARGPFVKIKAAAGVVTKDLGSLRASTLQKLFRMALEYENALLHRAIEERADVLAWYAPALFWPAFNNIAKPKLLCVPDVVMTNFPVGFALHGKNLHKSFETISQTIKGATDFVTYSEHVKWTTLAGYFGVSPSAVCCIRHAPVDLSRLVMVTGPNSEIATRSYCETLLASALRKSVKPGFTSSDSSRFKFLFYPSQFRPSKNIFTLLRAYEYLLRERFIGHKLILTCQISPGSELDKFIDKYDLSVDVLFLPRLSDNELAACYRLADLAVNPSLFEGGMPFTFSEALSVGTPVVMSDIEVTREVMSDPALCELTLFDPHDWKALASKIEWALAHRDSLLTAQRRFYDEKLADRTWDDVVSEHIAVLDALAVRVANQAP